MRNVLVTSVGSVIGYGIVGGLRECPYDLNIIGMDIYPSAVGRFFCDSFVQAVRADDPKYPEFLRDLVQSLGIELVLFGMEEEVNAVCGALDDLADIRQALAINSPSLIRLAHDKWEMYLQMAQRGLRTIPTRLAEGFDADKQALGLPILIKPRRASGSKGVCVAHTREIYDRAVESLGDNCMAQAYMGSEDEEYTACAFGLGDGTCMGELAMRRRLNGNGTTHKAQVVFDEDMGMQIQALCAAFLPVGPTNFQFRRHDGRHYLLEINPRISSASSMRRGFGCNEAKACVEYYLLGRRPEEPVIRPGIALRYYQDLFVYEDCFSI